MPRARFQTLFIACVKTVCWVVIYCVRLTLLTTAGWPVGQVHVKKYRVFTPEFRRQYPLLFHGSKTLSTPVLVKVLPTFHTLYKDNYKLYKLITL